MRAIIAFVFVALSVRSIDADPKKPAPRKPEPQPFFCSYINGSDDLGVCARTEKDCERLRKAFIIPTKKLSSACDIMGNARGGDGERVFEATCFDRGDPKSEICGTTSKACDWLRDQIAESERRTTCESRRR